MFVDNIATTKQIDWYQSPEIQSTIKTAAVATASAVTAYIIQKEKKYHHGWLVKIKIFAFYFGRNENYGKSEAVKNSKHEESCVVQMAYNCALSTIKQ